MYFIFLPAGMRMLGPPSAPPDDSATWLSAALLSTAGSPIVNKGVDDCSGSGLRRRRRQQRRLFTATIIATPIRIAPMRPRTQKPTSSPNFPFGGRGGRGVVVIGNGRGQQVQTSQ